MVRHPAPRGARPVRVSIGELETIRRRFAGAAIRDDIENQLLPLVQALKARAFDRADVNENIRPAIAGLDETEALLGVEPLHGSVLHGSNLCKTREKQHAGQRFQARHGMIPIDEKEEIVGQGGTQFRRGKFIRPKLDWAGLARRACHHNAGNA